MALLALLATCAWFVARNLATIEPPPAAAPATKVATEGAGKLPIVSVAPMMASAARAEERIENQEGELLRLRARVAELEQQLREMRHAPTARDFLARAAGIDAEKLRAVLIDSQLAASPAELDELLAAMPAAAVWAALDAERGHRVWCFEQQKAAPIGPDRQGWHDVTYRPAAMARLDDLCARLYAMSVPQAAVERFRSRLLEDL